MAFKYRADQVGSLLRPKDLWKQQSRSAGGTNSKNWKISRFCEFWDARKTWVQDLQRREFAAAAS